MHNFNDSLFQKNSSAKIKQKLSFKTTISRTVAGSKLSLI